MKTRFDCPGVWITGCGEVVSLKDMETPHLMNTVKMLIQKPDRTMAILIHDVENDSFSSRVWTPFKDDDKAQSIHNITSMTGDELIRYAMETPLFKSMLDELQARGVNVDNIVMLYSDQEV